MKKIFLLLLLNLFAIGNSQITAIPPAMENQTMHADDLLGKITKGDLQKAPFDTWFISGFTNYKPDAAAVSGLKKYSKDTQITIFMGTWCEDSQHRVPDFYKILDAAGFDEKNVTLIAVDKSKQTPEKLEAGKNITNVPTFIFSRNGKEIHRIVESPVETLEKDALNILSGQPYKHTYE
jgi:thiol-disulfide isomerase/thioredoxin